MISLARNILSKQRMYNTTAPSKTTTIPWKFSFSKLMKVSVCYRTLQSSTRSQSTEPVSKLASQLSAKIIENKFNLATLGKTRPKIEVDGMMLN